MCNKICYKCKNPCVKNKAPDVRKNINEKVNRYFKLSQVPEEDSVQIASLVDETTLDDPIKNILYDALCCDQETLSLAKERLEPKAYEMLILIRKFLDT